MKTKKVAIKIFGTILVLVLAAACTTTPESLRSGSVPDANSRDFGILVLSDLKNEEETAAYIAGASRAAGTMKIIPALPETIQALIMSDPDNLVWIADLMEVAGDVINFDTLIVAMPRHEMQQTTIMGIYTRSQDVIATTALTVDLEQQVILAYVQDYRSYNESAGAASITNAAIGSIEELLRAEE